MSPDPSLDHPHLARRLRARLAELNYSAEAIAEALGTTEETANRQAGRQVHARLLEPLGAFGTLVRLFALSHPVPTDQAAAALAPLGVDDLLLLGLAAAGDDGLLQPLLRLMPHEHLVLACDLPLQPGVPPAADHVPAVQNPSVALAQLTVRRPGSLLDLGTGLGVLALLGATHADRVLATDLNPHAVRLAAFSAQLNDLAVVECRQGSWFEPLAGERFDTIVCNPPYVISPVSEFIYRDSGLSGHSVSEQIVRELPAHLADDGMASVQISWIADPDGDLSAPVRDWLRDSGCDAILLHHATDTPLQAAVRWNPPDPTDPARQQQRIDQWLDYYAGLGIRGIAYGALVLRRRAGAHGLQTHALPPQRLVQASDHLLRLFAAQDLLAGADDDALLARRLRVAPGVVVEQQLRFHPDDGRPRIRQMTLRIEDGIGFEAGLDPEVMFLLTQLGSAPSLRAAFAQAAARGGVADADAYARAGLPMLRRMVALGFLAAAD
ncbi:MAG: methyltransferase [Aquabacterium sp.]